MMKDRFPTEEEQYAIYREHLSAFAPNPVTMRTLDIGGFGIGEARGKAMASAMEKNTTLTTLAPLALPIGAYIRSTCCMQ